jgi:hypothetical protein
MLKRVQHKKDAAAIRAKNSNTEIPKQGKHWNLDFHLLELQK